MEGPTPVPQMFSQLWLQAMINFPFIFSGWFIQENTASMGGSTFAHVFFSALPPPPPHPGSFVWPGLFW